MSQSLNLYVWSECPLVFGQVSDVVILVVVKFAFFSRTACFCESNIGQTTSVAPWALAAKSHLIAARTSADAAPGPTVQRGDACSMPAPGIRAKIGPCIYRWSVLLESNLMSFFRLCTSLSTLVDWHAKIQHGTGDEWHFSVWAYMGYGGNYVIFAWWGSSDPNKAIEHTNQRMSTNK